MSDQRQLDWDSLRFDLLREIASVQASGAHWDRVVIALARAFDGPPPGYGAYRPLRTFALTRWPQLRELVANERLTSELADEVVAVLDALHRSRRRAQGDVLEIEMAVLRELLQRPHG